MNFLAAAAITAICSALEAAEADEEAVEAAVVMYLLIDNGGVMMEMLTQAVAAPEELMIKLLLQVHDNMVVMADLA